MYMHGYPVADIGENIGRSGGLLLIRIMHRSLAADLYVKKVRGLRLSCENSCLLYQPPRLTTQGQKILQSGQLSHH